MKKRIQPWLKVALLLASISSAQAFATPNTLPLCAAIRGNGAHVFSTIASLAAITENYGMLDAVQGTSSGSVATFLYESMAMNPYLDACDRHVCTPHEKQLRMALLLKSFEGYEIYLTDLPEANSIVALEKLGKEFEKHKIDLLLKPTHVYQAAHLIKKILKSPTFYGLISREYMKQLEVINPWHLTKNIKRMVAAAKAAGSFKTQTNEILFRTSPLDMDNLAKKLGRVGNFYAAYGPANEKEWKNFFNTCGSENTFGQTWTTLAAANHCGELFHDLLDHYRSQLLTLEPMEHSREKDTVGANAHSIISSSAITGETLASFRSTRKLYEKGKDLSSFKPNFADFRVGYWGQSTDLTTIQNDPSHQDDLKTSRFLAFPEATWEDVLRRSAGEPGLSPILDLNEEVATAGGWMDSFGTVVMKKLGCEKVIYVTRRGVESDFAIGVARFLGMGPESEKNLVSLDPTQNPPSSYRLALQEASAVWCTDWNNVGSSVPSLVKDGYEAPLQSHDSFFTSLNKTSARILTSSQFVGCDPTSTPSP